MIRMNDFASDPLPLLDAEVRAVERVLRSGWYVLGNEVAEFENRWARVCGARHCVGVANGMDAIEIALRAHRIGPGDEVITTPMTAFATVLAVLRAGATPVLADINPRTALLEPESVVRCMTGRTRAVLLVHLYGQVRSMTAWQQLCASRNLTLIEDCAQAHLAAIGGQMAGSFGAAGAFSHYPTKNLGTAGDGGCLTTSDDSVASLARSLRNYGQASRYEHPELGLNSRLDELHAAILRERLEWLERFTQHRRAVADRYRAGIRNPQVRLMDEPEVPEAHVYHLFVVRSARRDDLASYLRGRGIESLVHYPIPVHLQPPCISLPRDRAGLGEVERHSRECLSIPCHHNLAMSDVDKVIEAINEFA